MSSDYSVKPGTTARLGRVEGELRVGRGATVTSELGNRVVVTATAYFEGPVSIDCDFECKSMRLQGRGFGPGGDVRIQGSLLVHEGADIDASVRVEGDVTAASLDVGGHLRSGSVTTGRLRVGGHLETRGRLKAEDVDTGGHMTVTGEVEARNLRVGGHANIGGGTIRGEIMVRGHLTTEKPLTYGQIHVFGRLRLPAGCSGDRLLAAGKVMFDGGTSCKAMEVGGHVKVNGDCSTEKLKVDGKLSVHGALKTSEKLEVFGSAEIGQGLECGSVAIGGRLVAESIKTDDLAQVGGQASTSRGLKAKSVKVGKGSKVSGPIIGERVDIGLEVVQPTGMWSGPWSFQTVGRTTRVDDVYGRIVRIGRYAKAERVYAETVELEDGSMVDEINYTSNIRLPKNCFLRKPPVKADRLPAPPL